MREKLLLELRMNPLEQINNTVLLPQFPHHRLLHPPFQNSYHHLTSNQDLNCLGNLERVMLQSLLLEFGLNPSLPIKSMVLSSQFLQHHLL